MCYENQVILLAIDIYGHDAADRVTSMFTDLTPGTFVHHPEHPEWGLGQVQSAVGNRVTANFQHAGKKLINTDVVSLTVVRAASPAVGGSPPS